MRHLLFFLLLFITVVSSNGQEKTKEVATSGSRKIQIGINVSPDLCFRRLQNNDGSLASDLIIQYNNEHERVKVGYTAGLSVAVNIKRNIGLETGIQYSNKGYKMKFNDYRVVDPLDPFLPGETKLIYNFHTIDIPVKANFFFGNKHLRFFTSVGLTTNIFLKETLTTVVVYSGEKVKQTNPTMLDYNKINISPTVSIGVDYRINERVNLRVEPTFRYGVLKITDSPVNGYLYNAGLNIGCYVGL